MTFVHNKLKSIQYDKDNPSVTASRATSLYSKEALSGRGISLLKPPLTLVLREVACASKSEGLLNFYYDPNIGTI